MRNLQKGFTLIELLIVIAIIAVVGAAAAIALNPVELINRGRDSANISKAKDVISACDAFMAANDGVGPANCAALIPAYLKTNGCTNLPAGITTNATTCSAVITITSTYYRAATRCGLTGSVTTCLMPGEL